MTNSEILLLLTRLLAGAFVTLFGIILWSQTRDIAWMLAIAASILWYGEILLSVFDLFGIIRLDTLSIGDVAIARILLAGLPPLVLGSAFIVLLVRRRIR